MDDVVQALSDQGVSKKVPEDVPQLLPPKHVEAVCTILPPCGRASRYSSPLMAQISICVFLISPSLSPVRTIPHAAHIQYAEADWHARGGRTYSEIQMDIANIQQHQYFPTFNSVSGDGPQTASELLPSASHSL